MKDNKKYNGYKNWATWNVVLWFNNDYYLYKLAKQAKTPHDLEVIFNSEIDMFMDFSNKDNEIDNIDWQEVYNNTGDRG
jgi:hypothetical protein